MTLAELKTAFADKFPSGSPSYHYGTAPNGTKLPYVVGQYRLSADTRSRS